MPRFLLCLVVLLWAFPLGAQHLPSPSAAAPDAARWRLKSQRQKNAARGLLIGGSVVGLASFIGYTSAAGELFSGLFSLQIDEKAARQMSTWRTVGAVGGLALLSSIPLGVAAKRNARKAQPDLTLQLGLRPAPAFGSKPPLLYPTLGLQLGL